MYIYIYRYVCMNMGLSKVHPKFGVSGHAWSNLKLRDVKQPRSTVDSGQVLSSDSYNCDVNNENCVSDEQGQPR